MASIIVVDDNRQYGETLKTFLGAKGYKVYHTESAKQAIELCALRNPDIVISDILMPEMDGIEFLLQLKTDRGSNLKGIIMISGGGLAEAETYLSMAESLGAAQVFTKPVSFIKLADAIENILTEDKVDP